MRTLLAAALVLLICSAGLCQDGPPAGAAGNARLEVDAHQADRPVLVVHYPWKAHAKPSIELRIMPEKEPAGVDARPLKFVDLFAKGPITAALFAARDKSWDLPFRSQHSERGREFEIVGRQNALGRPSVTVVVPGAQTVAEQQRRKQEDTSPRAVFYLLESWAFDHTTLRLELPEPYFAPPANVRVWFLRGGDVVWSETVAWPGLPNAKAPPIKAPDEPAKVPAKAAAKAEPEAE